MASSFNLNAILMTPVYWMEKLQMEREIPISSLGRAKDSVYHNGLHHEVRR
jgi:hypothetical protein